MINFWLEELSFTTLAIMLSFVVIVPIQVLICFKAKSRLCRFIPIIILAILTVASIVASRFIPDWNEVLFILGAIYLVVMIIMCGIGLVLWWIASRMKKQRNNTYPQADTDSKNTFINITFIFVPMMIIIFTVLLCFYVHYVLCDHLDEDSVTPETMQGELWEEMRVADGGYGFIIYRCETEDETDDNYLIAFQGKSIKEIENVIDSCHPSDYSTSYWEGEYRIYDFTYTYEFKNYLDELKSSEYTTEQEVEHETEAYASVKLYDLSSYKGYTQSYHFGMLLVEVVTLGFIIIVGFGILVIELIIASILKKCCFK